MVCKTSIWTGLLLSLALLSGCGNEKKKLPTAGETELDSGLVQEILNSTIYLYDGKRKLFRLESEMMRKNLVAEGKTLAYPVRLTIYDSLGRSGSTVLSDSGITDDRRDRFVIWGRVLIKTDDGKVIKTEKLWWTRASKRIYSDTLVQIETPEGDVMRGKGLEAAEDFSWWKLKRSVSGEFPNFRERLESDDPFLGRENQ